jgi:hypothetical protein
MEKKKKLSQTFFGMKLRKCKRTSMKKRREIGNWKYLCRDALIKEIAYQDIL